MKASNSAPLSAYADKPITARRKHLADKPMTRYRILS